MKRFAHPFLTGSLLLLTGCVLHAQDPRPLRYPLDAGAVARALGRDGFHVEPAQVQMPMPLSASVQSPDLQLSGADRLPDGRLRMRLRCRAAGECLAFSVTLAPAGTSVWAHAELPADALAAPSSSVGIVGPAAAGGEAAAPAVIVAGARLTMLLEDGHLHIHLPVIALGSAPAGAEVKVCTPDRKKTFRATVVDAQTVRGIAE